MRNSISTEFDLDEKLYRAVYPPEVMSMYWKENGELSSAVFKDKRGLSVERGYGRDDIEVVKEMYKYFVGLIYKLRVEHCVDIGAKVVYLPTNRSIYHSEIHGAADKIMLSASQCKYLAKKASLVSY